MKNSFKVFYTSTFQSTSFSIAANLEAKKTRAVSHRRGQSTNKQFYFKRSSAIGRVYTVHPKQDECFFVRLLLHTVKGGCSFEDLRTVNGEVKLTLKEACRCLDLLEDNSHRISAIEEAAVYATAFSLRTLFALLLTNCHVSDPVTIWNNCKESMTEDILHQCQT